MIYLFTFLTSLLVMLLITPRLREVAMKINYLEKPKINEERKIHREAKPYLAGIGIFLTFWACYFIFVRDFGTKTLVTLLSSTLIFGIGMVDDWVKIKGGDLSALPKALVQLTACVLVFLAGVRFQGFANPLTSTYILLPVWLQFPLTVAWLFGVTTVINFMDGMDGLAGGLSCITSCTLFIVALSKGNVSSALMAISLVGICLGYLKYNKFPAKILMGDAGATFLGFMLGFISLDGAFKQATVLSIFVPILALGLPIFDNLFVVFKRIKNRKPIFIGDATQVHYRLLAQGMTQKQVVNYLYLVNICLNLCAIIVLLI